MRVAVLGTGRMAEIRVPLLRRAGASEVIVAGGDPARTASVAGRLGATPSSVRDALASQPDGVVVASATDRHLEHLLAAAELGVPVLCEKPIALTVEDTRAAVRALGGAIVQVGFQRRFDPEIVAARAAGVGALYSLRITARDADPAEEHYIPGSGGIFRDMHVHDFDLARWITGREVATVYAVGAVRGFERFARHGDVDTSAVLLTMDDGMPVTIDGSRHDPRGYDVRVELLGSEDAVSVGPGVSALPRSFAERFAGAFAAETEAFLALVSDGGDSPCPPQSALEALRVAVACDRSRAERRPVELAEVD